MDPISFEDWVAMRAAAAAWGLPTMLATYRATEAQWAAWAGHWDARLAADPRGAQAGAQIEQEAARLRAGGAPRPRVGAMGPPHAAANPFGNAHEQAAFGREAAQVGDQIGAAFASLGSAVESLWTSAVMTVGTRVLVAWSDGNRYPGTVTQLGGGQVEVAFPDGRRVWVPQAYVSVT
jgi:hypothetical protein